MVSHRIVFGLGVVSAACGARPLGAVQTGASLSGNVLVRDKGGKLAKDLSEAVVWIEGAPAGPARAPRAEIATEKKQFVPHVMVVSSGATVVFPNHDPFNHNAFSLSENGPFDLGLYGRGESRTATFPRPAVIRVYCNVHAQMSAFVVVTDSPFHTQPAADGSFAITGVPPGAYTVHAWHERGGEATVQVQLTGAGLTGIALSLDAAGFKFKPHLNKLGQPYDDEGRRY